MLLCTYARRSNPYEARSGLFVDGLIYDIFEGLKVMKTLAENVPLIEFTSLIGILKIGRNAIDALRRLEENLKRFPEEPKVKSVMTREEDAFLRAPLPRPNSIRDFMLYKDHMVNSMRAFARINHGSVYAIDKFMRDNLGKGILRTSSIWNNRPLYYKGNPDSVVGPNAVVKWPAYSRMLDYELEFGIYIMRGASNISKKNAASHIGGYTIFNDFSARDVQYLEIKGKLGPCKSKDFDTGNAMGPFLVTADEITDPHNLKMEAFVNGELWSSGSSSGMRYSFEELIEYVSRNESLHAGDFFGSGTIGMGCGMELDKWLKPDDNISLKVERLGTLSNTVKRI